MMKGFFDKLIERIPILLPKAAWRSWIATLLFVPALWVATRVVLDAGFKPDRQAAWATLALVAALIVGGQRVWKRTHVSIWVAVAAALILIPAVIIARAFGRVDMMAILFHAEFGMKGSTLKGLENQIVQAVLAVVYLLLPVTCIGALWGWGQKLYLSLGAVLLAANPFVRFAISHYALPAIDSDLSAWLVPPDLAKMTKPDPLPDIVIIYLEGTDRRYADKSVWGELYAPLHALAAEGTSFTGVSQIEGTGWSLAGMVASQCGVPVVPRGMIYRNGYDDVEGRFMPNVTCLGDIFEMWGYTGAYIVGGDEGFAGINTFYDEHGGPDILGPDSQRSFYSAEEFEAAHIDWVQDDQMTFDTARIALRGLADGSAPFFMVVETIGPHGYTGYLSRRCSPTGLGVVSHDIARVVECTLSDTAAFIADLKRLHAESRPRRPLGIVLLSDHLSHYAGKGVGGPDYENANTAIMIGLDAIPGRVVDKRGAMIDIFPTLLQWAGFSDGPNGNLGRSLLSEAMTITADHGAKRLSDMLISDAAFSNRIWD